MSSSDVGRHSKWRRSGKVLMGYLRPFRKLIRRRRIAKVASSTTDIERGGSKILIGTHRPILLNGEIAIRQTPVATRANSRKKQQRHDSQQSPLAPIPETETVDEEIVSSKEIIYDEEIKLLPLPRTATPRATLLEIPPELRNQIYEHVFSDWHSLNPLAFLQTCRQVHTEAADLAFSKTLFRLHTEHWADHDFFQARYTSHLPPTRLSSVRHLALRLPRGAPYDCYNSRRLHVDLLALGLNLTTLVIFSHHPRPLPRISDYGGVTEIDLCHWLSDTLYTMTSLRELHIMNYESPSPGLFDIPSPRLVRLLRGQIYRDVMTERQSLSEEEFQWHCHCEQDRSYGVFSSKLGRTVKIMFETGEELEAYGLGHINDLSLHLNSDEMLCATPPDLSHGASVCATRSNSSRKRLNKKLSLRYSMRHNIMARSSDDQISVVPEPPPTNRAFTFAFASAADAAPKRKRLSKRYSLQSTVQSNTAGQPLQQTAQEQQLRHIRHRQSWHASSSTVATPIE
jgi:hypothetical protein